MRARIHRTPRKWQREAEARARREAERLERIDREQRARQSPSTRSAPVGIEHRCSTMRTGIAGGPARA